MTRPVELKRFRALYYFSFVLVVFLAIAAIIPLVQFRGEVMDIAAADAERDLELLGSLIYEAMLRHDYTAVREAITLWSQENDRVVSITAVAPNGFVFAESQREMTEEDVHVLAFSKEVMQGERLLVTLNLREDFSLFVHEAETLIRRNILAFAVFTVAMGAVLWTTLRRTAILPMEGLIAEVQDLNTTLETKVGERTGDLTRANEELEREIGERLEVEERLRESEKRYRTILANAADAVFLLEPSSDGPPVIIEANEAACRMHGYSREELVGRPISLLDDKENKELIPERQAALQEGRKLTFEVTHMRKDGSSFPLEVSAQLVSVGGKAFIVSLERDITRRKEEEAILATARESLEQQNEELRKIDQMKDAFLRDVSHELKTPVAKHAMQLEVLRPILEQHGVGEGGRRVFDVMEESVRRQQDVIRNLLNLSRLESGGRTYSREDVHLEKLLRKVLEDYGESFTDRGIGVAIDAPAILVQSDMEMLWHVFSNLISNAIKFQRPDGSPEISVSAALEEGQAVVRIEDNGVGMSRDIQGKLFTRFFQSSPSTEGSGVGLMICKRIVEDLGGTIRLESPGPGKGCVAEVRLPLG